MPRINIDEKLFIDPRFRYLEGKFGCENALGKCVKLWFLAQNYYVPNRKPIPENLLVMSGLPVDDLLFSGFLVKQDEGYYAAGSEQSFNWLFKSIENGKKGGRRTHVLPTGTVQVEHRQTTSSSSSSSSSSNKEKKKGTRSAEASPTSLPSVLEYYASKYNSDFLTEEFEKCREYHYAKSGVEVTLRHMSTWLRTEWGKASWEKFQLTRGLKKDAMSEYFDQLLSEHQ